MASPGGGPKPDGRKKRAFLLLLIALVLLAFSALTAVQARPRMQNVLLAGAVACAAAGVTFLVRYRKARRRESPEQDGETGGGP